MWHAFVSVGFKGWLCFLYPSVTSVVTAWSTPEIRKSQQGADNAYPTSDAFCCIIGPMKRTWHHTMHHPQHVLKFLLPWTKLGLSKFTTINRDWSPRSSQSKDMTGLHSSVRAQNPGQINIEKADASVNWSVHIQKSISATSYWDILLFVFVWAFSSSATCAEWSTAADQRMASPPQATLQLRACHHGSVHQSHAGMTGAPVALACWYPDRLGGAWHTPEIEWLEWRTGEKA